MNGEFIVDPEEDSRRFHSLEPGDFVIFDFVGDLEPISARAVFIAQALEVDSSLYEILNAHIGAKSMISLRSGELERLIARAQLLDQHPVNLLVLEASIEDAAYGGLEGVKKLRSGPFKGRVSRQTLEQARRSAQKTGRRGEEFVFSYLESQKELGEILDFRWEADINAISPYDFFIEELDRSNTLIDVKATSGNFENRLHVSYNELLQMKDADQYDLYRIFNIVDDSAQLRIAKNLKIFAKEIIEVLEKLPLGIYSDGISLNPIVLEFGDTIEVEIKAMN